MDFLDNTVLLLLLVRVIKVFIMKMKLVVMVICDVMDHCGLVAAEVQMVGMVVQEMMHMIVMMMVKVVKAIQFVFNGYRQFGIECHLHCYGIFILKDSLSTAIKSSQY